MKFGKDPSLTDRLSTQAGAKSALLEKFRKKPGPDDPEVQKRQAERRAVADARDIREAEQRAAREAAAKAAHLAEVERVRLAAEEAERTRLASEQYATEMKLREEALEIERKAKRDARYAARKGRK